MRKTSHPQSSMTLSYGFLHVSPFNPTIDSLTSLLWVVMVDIFFREIRSRGSYRIPRRGPVIFVAAPHANQVSILHRKLLD